MEMLLGSLRECQKQGHTAERGFALGVMASGRLSRSRQPLVVRGNSLYATPHSLRLPCPAMVLQCPKVTPIYGPPSVQSR